MENICNILVGKPEWKRPLERCGRGWENNIKIDLREIGSRVWTRFIWLWIGIDSRLL
jgi:hypothetical protein